MTRQLFAACVFLTVTASSLSAQDWARKLFKETEHDFGAVARGSDAAFEFEIVNPYKEEIHVASVRTSCNCTTPSIVNDTLKTRENGAILAKFNTRSFVGNRRATITVVIDRPYYAEVQLNVRGFIRSDVVFDPGSISFGEIEAGQAAENRVRVNYAGRDDWQIVDVRSAFTDVEVELEEVTRGGGRVAYDMVVRVKPDAEIGDFQGELVVVTDDHQLTNVALPIQARVTSPLRVNSSLLMGVVSPGQEVSKNLVVRAKQPFRIVDIDCPDGCFKFNKSIDAKRVHIIPVKFKAGEELGSIKQNVRIKTDLQDGLCCDCVVIATIVAEH